MYVRHKYPAGSALFGQIYSRVHRKFKHLSYNIVVQKTRASWRLCCREMGHLFCVVQSPIKKWQTCTRNRFDRWWFLESFWRSIMCYLISLAILYSRYSDLLSRYIYQAATLVDSLKHACKPRCKSFANGVSTILPKFYPAKEVTSSAAVFKVLFTLPDVACRFDGTQAFSACDVWYFQVEGRIDWCTTQTGLAVVCSGLMLIPLLWSVDSSHISLELVSSWVTQLLQYCFRVMLFQIWGQKQLEYPPTVIQKSIHRQHGGISIIVISLMYPISQKDACTNAGAAQNHA